MRAEPEAPSVKAALPVLLALAGVAGCLDREPVPEAFEWGPCPTIETSGFRIEVDGKALVEAYLVAGTTFRPALSCAAAPMRAGLPADGGVAAGEAGRYDYQEIRLFFGDGTLRLGVDLPEAASHDLSVRMGPPPTLADGGVAVPVARSEWLDGPGAGRDVHHGVGFVPLRTHNESMAITVASAWNERLLVQAALSYEPYVPGTVEDAGGRVRFTVVAPDGTVAAEREARDPNGNVHFEAGPGVAPGTWTVRFEHRASGRTHPQMLDSVSAWLTY
jgi:hypothetical protein